MERNASHVRTLLEKLPRDIISATAFFRISSASAHRSCATVLTSNPVPYERPDPYCIMNSPKSERCASHTCENDNVSFDAARMTAASNISRETRYWRYNNLCKKKTAQARDEISIKYVSLMFALRERFAPFHLFFLPPRRLITLPCKKNGTVQLQKQ